MFTSTLPSTYYVMLITISLILLANLALNHLIALTDMKKGSNSTHEEKAHLKNSLVMMASSTEELQT
jgi:hypothetical protein